jgi:hypothetical protein
MATRHAPVPSAARSHTPVKFILLHDTKNDDGIRLFFGDVWELYTKVSNEARRRRGAAQHTPGVASKLHGRCAACTAALVPLDPADAQIMLNPFHTVNTPIRNPAFEAKVRASAKKNL